MSSLKQKAIKGASWGFMGRILQQGVQFVFGIILARLLLPEEYGLVAMAMVFITFFQVFVNFGFGTAIIQRKQINSKDLSTVFYINLGVSLILYLMLFVAAKPIADFYNEPQLVDIIKVLSVMIILYALTIVQNSLIIRNVNFKLRTRIELISQIISSTLAIYMAYTGWGVWTIIWKVLLNQVLVNIQLWINNKWMPSLVFSKSSFNDLFSFSGKLLISGILDSFYQQIYRLVVGKFFPAADLGYYARAEQFNNLPSKTVSGSLLSFLLPIMSKMQDNPQRLKNAVKKVLKLVMFFNIISMTVLGIIAAPLITVLLGDKWISTIPFLQLLVFVGVLYPMHMINVQILTALGRSDLFLRIEIIKKILAIPSILFAIFIGIKAMIIAMIFTSFIGLIVNTYYTGKLINFGFFEQLRSLKGSVYISLVLVLLLSPIVYFFSNYSQLLILFLVPLLAFTITILMAHLIKMEEYSELKLQLLNLKSKYVK